MYFWERIRQDPKVLLESLSPPEGIDITEGDSPLHGTWMGRVGWFDSPDWEPTILRDDMHCPHTVQIADLDGNGHPDIHVAEMGAGENHQDAEHVDFRNRGDAEFEAQVVEHGLPTHEAEMTDLTGDGRLDIIGKSYEPDVHVDAWYDQS